MRRMIEKDLQGFRSEFEMTCAAQDGDGRAWLLLYNHYKTMMMSQLIAVRGFTREELESEAIDVFAHKLESFNRGKVSSEKAYSMFSWLWCAVLNRTNQLIRQRKRDVHLYFEDVNAGDDRDGISAGCYYTKGYLSNNFEDLNPLQNQMLGINDEIYSIYNPEKIVVERLHDNDTDRVKAFYAKLTQFQRDILAARREGLTLAQISKRFCCSVTTIKNHILKAKRRAGDIFQVCYA